MGKIGQGHLLLSAKHAVCKKCQFLVEPVGCIVSEKVLKGAGDSLTSHLDDCLFFVDRVGSS